VATQVCPLGFATVTATTVTATASSRLLATMANVQSGPNGANSANATQFVEAVLHVKHVLATALANATAAASLKSLAIPTNAPAGLTGTPGRHVLFHAARSDLSPDHVTVSV